MGTMAIFIFKVLILSVGVSVLIRYGAPSLAISPTSVNAVIAILVPPLVLAIALFVRAGQYRQGN